MDSTVAQCPPGTDGLTSWVPRTALVVMPCFGNGGAEIVQSAVARVLSARGCAVTVASIGGEDLAKPDIGQSRLIVKSGRGKLHAEWRLLDLVAGTPYDLVFSSHLRINAALCGLRRLGVLRTRRLVTRESMVAVDTAVGGRLLAYKALYALYGSQDLIVAQTSYMADKLKGGLSKRAGELVSVVPNPVDVRGVQAMAAEPPPDDLQAELDKRRYICWCGRLIDIKRPLLALDVLAEVRRTSGEDIGLLIVGGGPLEGQVRQAVARQGLQHAVVMVGRVNNPYSMMARCHFGLMTSLKEGFPNVLLEMMASGIDAIATTDCAGDLHSLGIEVCESTPAALARGVLAAAQRETEKHRTLLLERSPDAFVNRLLNEHGASVLAATRSTNHGAEH